MATFPSNRPTTDVEGKGADSFATRSKAGSNAGAQKLFGAMWAVGQRWGRQGSGEGRGSSFASAKASSSGQPGRSAESYHNENLMKQYEWQREQKGKDKDVGRASRHIENVSKLTPEGRTFKAISSDHSKGAFNATWENAPAPKTETPKTESGNVRGRQFLGATIPAVPGERPGHARVSSEGKFEANPAYGEWKARKAKFESGIESQTKEQLHVAGNPDIKVAPPKPSGTKKPRASRAKKAV